MVTAKNVIDILEMDNPFRQISSRLVHPVWSFSIGEPSLEEVMKQDKYIVNRRFELQIDSKTLKDRPVEKSINDPLLSHDKNQASEIMNSRQL